MGLQSSAIVQQDHKMGRDRKIEKKQSVVRRALRSLLR